MSAQQLAEQLYAYFDSLDYPIMGVTLHTDALLPWIELWDDTCEVSRAIVCYAQADGVSPASEQARGIIATWQAAGEAACGAVAMIASWEGFMEVGEV